MALTDPPAPNGSPYLQSLIAGGLAGTTVDLSLFPIDTLKTRLQSSAGFAASGGLRGVYAGVGAAIAGSAPNAALFFITYERTKDWLAARRGDGAAPGTPVEHMLAASAGEVAACAVRVPTEVVKQRAQAAAHRSSAAALRTILGVRATAGVGGVVRELYRGWGITVLREVPFTVIQFPLWEALKRWRGTAMGRAGGEATAAESAVFGAVSGAVAAGATTPLDVLKTRTMLSTERVRLDKLALDIWSKEGSGAFFAGIAPRITWISIGGAVFLGSYQWARNSLVGVI